MGFVNIMNSWMNKKYGKASREIENLVTQSRKLGFLYLVTNWFFHTDKINMINVWEHRKLFDGKNSWKISCAFLFKFSWQFL